METLGLDHYNLRAPQPLLEALRAFYCDVVGLRVGDRPAFSTAGYWLYAGSQPVLHLTQAREGQARPAGTPGTFDHAAFSCTGRAAFEARLQQHGVRYRRSRVPQTSQVQLFITDPAGNGVELNFAGAADAE